MAIPAPVSEAEVVEWFNDVAASSGPWSAEEVRPLVESMNRSIGISLLPQAIVSSSVLAMVDAWGAAEKDSIAALRSLRTLKRHLDKHGDKNLSLDQIIATLEFSFTDEADLFSEPRVGRRGGSLWKTAVRLHSKTIVEVFLAKRKRVSLTSPGPASRIMSMILKRIYNDKVEYTTIAREMRADRRKRLGGVGRKGLE